MSEPRRRQELVMGTVATVELCDPVPDEGALDAVFAWLHQVDRRFSTYKEDSEVERLNRGELRPEDASPDMRFVLDECARLWRVTDGFFDANATGRFDPSGFVKGWSVQVASERLTAAGVPNHLVDAGGDIQTRGTPEPGRPWQVGVRHPWQKDKVAFVLTGDDLAVATSGTYERGLHVVDPRTGRPAAEIASVTVVGRDLGVADAYATAAVAMGRAALDWLANLAGFESAVIFSDETMFVSGKLPQVAA
jgi:thiamine biosynthesis lipoprotein